MIITDQFVMLNLPKTGSTFAREAMKQLYKNRFRQLPLKRKIAIKSRLSEPLLQELEILNVKFKQGLNRRRDPHGTYQEIPDKYKNRVIFSIVRNPYQRLLSAYEYRHWARWPILPNDVLAQHFPNFPKLSINEYVKMGKMSTAYRSGFEGKDVHIGAASIQFIQMFFKDPVKVLQNITDAYLDSDEVFEDMADITFLRQECLRNDLKEFLRKHGFTNAELGVIDEMKAKNVTTNKVSNRKELLTPEVINYVNTENRLIFKLLRKKGIEYPMIQP